MKIGIAEIFKKAEEQKTADGKASVLQQHDSPTLRKIIDLCYNPNNKWLLPEGAPPYKPSEFPDQEGRLYSEMRRMYLFLEGGNPNLSPIRREFLFIQLLESVSPDDAELLIGVKDGKLPYKGITKKVIMKAFPDMFEEQNGQDKDEK